MIENIGLLRHPPDWQFTVTETLAWLTSVAASPIGAEQRMGLRLSPRQMFEINYTLFGPERTAFDMAVMAMGGSPFYLPVWHDTNRIAAPVTPGMMQIPVDTTYSELADCRLAVLLGDSLYTSEIVEIDGRSSNSLTLVGGLTGAWPAGTRIFPVKKVKFETQPSGDRHADRAYRGRARFLSLEPNRSSALPAVLGSYRGFYVLEAEPNEMQALAHHHDRLMFTLDTELGLQHLADIAGIGRQSYSWFARGRAAQWQLRGLFYALEGRRLPVWIPSFFADFDLAAPIGATDTALIVKRCGFTDAGGPFKNREDILILLADGSRFYRRITGAALVGAGATESLGLDVPLGRYIRIDEVLRISFLTFSRLDQDSIELQHHTDTHGLTTATAVFRNAADLVGLALLGLTFVTQPEQGDISVPPPPPPGVAGKYYFEMTITHVYTSGISVAMVGAGICSATAALTSGDWTNAVSQAAEAQTCGQAGNAVGDGRGVGYPAHSAGVNPNLASGAGTISAPIAFAVDTINKRIWFKDLSAVGSSWIGDGTAGEDPGTGVGGFNFASVITGNIFAFAGATQNNDTNFGAGTMNFGASAFVGALPAGYSAWGASDTLNPADNSVLNLTSGNLSFSSVGNGALAHIGKLCRSIGSKLQG